MARYDWAAEDTLGIFFFEADNKEGGPQILIPVVRDSLKAIQDSYEMEVSVLGGNGEIFRGE